MPTLTVTDLRDPAPPVPGPAHRAAVAARAKQLSRRRRFAQIGGTCGPLGQIPRVVEMVVAIIQDDFAPTLCQLRKPV
jgi:hypothetical protein